MNAEEFYEAFKEALDYLGVGFQGKEQAVVAICENKLTLTAGNRSAALSIPIEQGERK